MHTRATVAATHPRFADVSRGAPAGGTEALAFFVGQRPDPNVRHVHLMHLDGFHAGIFRQLLDRGMLPHFSFLLNRGKLSYAASTVDKSETFKVIQSYLTSRWDTQVTAWWYFSRDQFRFRNYWLDPVEVANYALGLEFPVYPTVFDVVAARAGNVVAGFSLHRRSVPFNNYSRNYVEGAVAAFKHTYFTQAHATMSSLLQIYERIARSEREKIPAFALSLLAVVDEFGHLDGIVLPRGQDAGNPAACFERKHGAARSDDIHEVLFQILEEDDTGPGWIRQLYHSGLSEQEIASGKATGYFTRVEKGTDGIRRLCIQVPQFETAAWPVTGSDGSRGTVTREFAAPRTVLGMIQTDIELGRLINTLRAIRIHEGGRHSFDPSGPNGILAYLAAQKQEHSLFETTLFVLLGDHGMVDTACKMAPVDPAHADPRRHTESLRVTFLEYLNAKLGLATTAKDAPVPPGTEIGIDDTRLPAQLAFPHLDRSWQSPVVRRRVAAAERWSQEFFDDIKDALKGELYKKYWWLLMLRRLLVDPQLEKTLEPYRPTALATLAQLYLRGEPDYVAAERRALRKFYDDHVRLVYGGGARNNAELFLPTWKSGPPSWDARPSFDEITRGRGAAVMRAVQQNPGVALIFVRKANGAISAAGQLADRMAILVMDRRGNAGTITVHRQPDTGILLFGYQVDPSSRLDPLGYGDLGQGEGTWGTYNEWNDLSVRHRHYYHNVVAGMGSYLYSTNPSIGDITLMHSQGWNFGDNSAGHGGLHREEKLSVLLVSGPGIRRGDLMATARYATRNGKAVRARPVTHPTVLDVAPTTLAWLGYGDTALADFARRGFAPHLKAWVAAQRADLLSNLDNVENLNQALREAGFSDLRMSRFRSRLARLLAFLPHEPPELPDYSQYREDGNLLNLDAGTWEERPE